MRKFLRTLFCALFLLFAWPFFLYKKYGGRAKLCGKTVIICNHYSTFDAFFIYLAFRDKNIRYITIKEVKDKLLPRFVCWLFNCLYIDYESCNLNFFKECISVLNGGGAICIFPEGAVNPAKYGFFDFKSSFVYLARKTDAKILPLYIYPQLKPFKKSRLYVGKAYCSAEYAGYKTLYEAATFFQCKIIEYGFLCDN